MIRINLLPVKTSRKLEVLKQELLLAGVGLGALLILCLLATAVLMAKAADQRAELEEIEKKIAELKIIADRVDEIQRIREELQTKLGVIGQLKKGQTGPVRMLDELAEATPEQLSLTEMVEARGKLELNGVAESNEVISTFLTNLERSEWFSQVYLVGIDQDDKSGTKAKLFEVTAQWATPKTPEEIKAEEEARKKAAKAEADAAKAKTKAKAKAAEPAPAEGGAE